ncbi:MULTISPECIES: acyl-CoA thioesterase [unclassified Nocardioides]|uniref:acyl-CoA thioesterase n=1 Tax=unclassified Nocardioides TaxID=2615069 RepID=UPI0036D25D97
MPATALVDLLDLEEIDVNLFRGRQSDTDRQRVFGGQVAAQALIAGVRTVDPEFGIHSLHSYFLRPGDTQVPIVYDVEGIRDGRSFATRRVVARQHGRPIYYLTASFQRPEEGLEHQDVMPEAPGPESGLSLTELWARRSEESEAESLAKEFAALDARYLGNSLKGLEEEDPAHPARARMWVRVTEDLGDDPVRHLAAFTYASDMSLLGATLVPHRAGPPEIQMASLDHTIWFHRPFRADQWWLYDQVSPSAQGARGLAIGRVFTEDGRLVATVAQEGLIRPVTPRA